MEETTRPPPPSLLFCDSLNWPKHDAPSSEPFRIRQCAHAATLPPDVLPLEALNLLLSAASRRLQWLNKQISSLGQRKELSKAVSCFDQVSSEGLTPSVHTYTSIINAHVRSGEIDAAEEYLARMRGAGLSPNVVTYTTLLKGFTQIGDLEKASGLLEQMEKDVPPVAPNVRTVNTMLRGCIRANDVPTAVRCDCNFQGVFRCKTLECAKGCFCVSNAVSLTQMVGCLSGCIRVWTGGDVCPTLARTRAW